MSRNTLLRILTTICALAIALPAAAGTPVVAARLDQIGAPGLRLLDPQKLNGANWRAELASDIDQLPELRASRAVTGSLAGHVLASDLRLPARVDLTGDTTIVARRLVLTGNTVRIVGHGHSITLKLIDGIEPTLPTGSVALLAATSATVTIDNHGSPGSSGAPGSSGFGGGPGFNGMDGIYLPDSCVAQPGEDGGAGSDGGGGNTAGMGGNGNDGGNITLDIPSGSQDSYVLNTTGGDGGEGGTGGSGGPGGVGGNGGHGADMRDPQCAVDLGSPAGNGGNGGPGGAGGSAGDGGPGGNGGHGGNITVTYPVGYNPANISANAAGGAIGGGGSTGTPGDPGTGGQPGPGGFNANDGTTAPSGQPGGQGIRGGTANVGSDGAAGGAGVVSITQR